MSVFLLVLFFSVCVCVYTVTLTNVSEGGGHRVCSSLIAGQAAIHPSILLLHVPYKQRAIRSHPMSEHTRYTIQYSILCTLKNGWKNWREDVRFLID